MRGRAHTYICVCASDLVRLLKYLTLHKVSIVQSVLILCNELSIELTFSECCALSFLAHSPIRNQRLQEKQWRKEHEKGT